MFNRLKYFNMHPRVTRGEYDMMVTHRSEKITGEEQYEDGGKIFITKGSGEEIFKRYVWNKGWI